MTDENGAPAAAPEPASAISAGTRLREARVAAGLSIDAVGQQLKLAPRQVVALEECDFSALPGRTFVRGFVRNYARLLRLDAAELLESLPEPGATPGLSEPSLAPSPRPMGELPADANARPSAARWAIPLALVAIIGVAAVYELTRPLVDATRAERAVETPQVVTGDAATGTQPAGATAPADASPAAETAVRTEASPSAVETVPASPPSDAPLGLVFRGTSWVEVKDAKGTVVLSTMGYPGARHATGGALPLEVVIGNAEAVTVTWRGKAFDTAAHTRQNVAKFTLN